jgi:hypothetical protein
MGGGGGGVGGEKSEVVDPDHSVTTQIKRITAARRVGNPTTK